MNAFVSLIYFQVDFSSGRFIRIDLQGAGAAITLQAHGADFKNSEGLCGNFDSISINDLTDIKSWMR